MEPIFKREQERSTSYKELHEILKRRVDEREELSSLLFTFHRDKRMNFSATSSGGLGKLRTLKKLLLFIKNI